MEPRPGSGQVIVGSNKAIEADTFYQSSRISVDTVRGIDGYQIHRVVTVSDGECGERE